MASCSLSRSATSALVVRALHWGQIFGRHEPRDCVAIPFFRHALLKLAMSGLQPVYATDIKRVFGRETSEQEKLASLLAELRSKLQEAGLVKNMSPEMLMVMGVAEVNMAAKVLNIIMTNEQRYKHCP